MGISLYQKCIKLESIATYAHDRLRLCGLTKQRYGAGFKDKNGKTVRACRVEQLYHLPRILVLQLKRFAYDTNLHRIIKIKKTIKYGERLRCDLSSPGHSQKKHVSMFEG